MLLNLALLTHRKTLAPISVLPPKVLALARICTATRARSLDDSSLWARISGNQTSTASLVDLLDARAPAERAARHLLGTLNAETLACSLRTSRIIYLAPYMLRFLLPGFVPTIV
ncbi:hypothetical protein BC826DRAFT_1110467 [Russula brevipes]|nr:hypothetical protein BC826DRAFT_1110467 [Russula brevipes]